MSTFAGWVELGHDGVHGSIFMLIIENVECLLT